MRPREPASATAREISALDEAWLIEPYRTHDMAAYDRLVAADFTITHGNGAVLSKPETRADVLSNPLVARDAPFRRVRSDVRLYRGGTVAVSVGVIAEEASDVHFTNTYVREGGGWRVVASQLTRRRRP